MRVASHAGVDLLALALVAVVLWFPTSAVDGHQLVAGEVPAGPLTVRLGPASLMELAFVPFVLAWLGLRLAWIRPVHVFDLPLCVAAIITAGCLGLAWLAEPGAPRRVLFDTEHLVAAGVAYMLVSRSIHSRTTWRLAIGAFGIVILAAGLTVLIRYGIIGSTAFRTSSGREALLITEDSLLLGIPVILLAGVVAERSSGLAVTVFILIGATVLLVDVISLRRGALIFIGAALVARFAISYARLWKRIAAMTLALLTAAALTAPGREAVDAMWDRATSAVTQRGDASTKQREIELRALDDNMSTLSWLFGRGVGALWFTDVIGPQEAGTHGKNETPTQRIGWHVFGLDWLYKFGFLGLTGLAAVCLWLLGVTRNPLPHPDRGFLVSLWIVLFVLLGFMWNNLRIAFAAGVVLGLLGASATLTLQLGAREKEQARLDGAG